MVKQVQLGEFQIGGEKLTIMAGPCAIESEEITFEAAKVLQEICLENEINFIFKSSFDKANRSSLESYRGLGIEKGLEILSRLKEEFKVPIVTDVHSVEQVEKVAKVADVIQIPAFLCRQTDLLVEAAKTGRIVNIKKGQFLSPKQIKSIAKKVKDSNNDQIIITERGSSFGYNNLVVDFRAIPIIQSFGYPLIFDATHSVQLPGGNENSSSGDRQFVPTLSKAAIAAGANGLFFEVHPNPDKALCDGSNMIDFQTAKKLFKECREIFELVKIM